MKAALYTYERGGLQRHPASDEPDPAQVQFVLCFGQRALLTGEDLSALLSRQFPKAELIMASTAGEIYHDTVRDAVSVTAIQFEQTRIQTVRVNIDDYSSSREAGKALVTALPDAPDLNYLLVLSDGGKVNGSELVQGINSIVQQKVPVTGGLAGDGTDFLETVVGLNAVPRSGEIVLVGFYGQALSVTHGSMGGWEVFGPEKMITKSVSNQLFEINHESALDLYKKYLGPYADELPRSALLFPLAVQLPGHREPVVRTILSIDNHNRSMIFAGDVPEGARVRFMKANFDKLVVAASDAASQTLLPKGKPPRLSLLISCVGRKIILGPRIDEEVEAVLEVLGDHTLQTGFYSYGEISPFSPNATCELHNQTMTITTFSEQ